MKIFLILCMSLCTLAAQAQNVYPAHQTDFIFSLAQMNSTTGVSSSPVLRFSGFINYESQLHFDFSKSFGLYTGLGLKNIGMINHFDYYKTNLKQRAYALSVPLAAKLGNMKNQSYIALGGELDLMMHYKQKFLYGDTKIKQGEWFSNKLNLLNPAVFLQFKFLRSQVITVKYFLNDFLRYQSAGLTLPDGTLVPDYGMSSKLFYISWGTHIAPNVPEAQKEKKREAEMKSARWVE